MCVYLRNKFQVSGVILTSFRQVGVILPPPPQNEPLKKSSLISVNTMPTGKLAILVNTAIETPIQ